MCGRYTLDEGMDEWSELKIVPDWRPRFNIAPTQDAPVILDEDGKPAVAHLRWGLIPSWANSASVGARAINARSETVETKPSFREAYRSRRCLVPASGFYEWKRSGPHKRPHWIHRADRRSMAFAGLWESWRGPQGTVRSFAIVTCPPNTLVAELHDRMPVIVPPADYRRWLGGEDVGELLRPFDAEAMAVHPVSQRVGNVANDDPRLIEMDERGQLSLFDV